MLFRYHLNLEDLGEPLKTLANVSNLAYLMLEPFII